MKHRKSHSRRKRRTIWWTPPTGASSYNDPTNSCWADVGTGFFPVGSASAPAFGISPIITNLKQQLDPAELTDPEFAQHPVTERWRVERIVGSVAVQAISTAQPQLYHDGIDVHMGIVRRTATHDAVSMVFPDPNDESLSDWLWLKHFSMSAAALVCHVCDGVDYGVSDGGNCSTCPGQNMTAISTATVFGVPALTWTDVDVRVRRNITTETGLWLVVRATVATTAVDRVALSWQPKLRALLSRSV